MAEPYIDDAELLRDELLCLDARLLLHVARVRQAVGGDPATRGLGVDPGVVREHFEGVPGEPLWARSPVHDGLQPLADELEEQRVRLAARRLATRASGRVPRLERLVEVWGLDPLERELLVLALAPELDLRYERLFGWLHDDVARTRPSMQLALDLLADDFSARLALRERLVDPDAPLRRHGLVALVDAEGEGPLLRCGLVVAPGAVRWLGGGPPLAPALAPWLGRHVGAAGPSGWPADLQARRERLVARHREPGASTWLQLWGPAGVGRRSFAASVCAELSRPLYVVDVRRAAALDLAVIRGLADAAVLAARLAGAGLCWSELDAVDDERRAAALTATAAGRIDLVFCTWSKDPLLDALPGLAAPDRCELAAPGAARRAELWAQALPGLDPRAAALAAESCRLTPGQIHAAAAAALGSARDGGALDADALVRAARRHATPRLGHLATRVTTSADWDDLVLPEDRRAQLHTLVRRHRHHRQVLDAWNFRGRHPTAQGLSALFSGPPGTGKTMAAAIVARAIGRELYRIDLSQVVSKYIGETEKQLELVFAEAEATDVALFFDEADALFGKRSAVNDAHDRYANLEVSYLLQRLETYPGVAILASNARRHMDEAFLRRLQVIVEFPLPGCEERAAIWRGVWPREAPRDATLDPQDLAARFELTGGHIRNIAVAAAFAAAEDGAAIGLRHVLAAAQSEYGKMSKILDARRFDP